MKRIFYLIFTLTGFLNAQNLSAQKHFVTGEDSIKIDQQLDEHFGIDYELDDYILVDSLEKHYDRQRGVIDDEYGTLKDCIVFTAEINGASRNVKGIVGIYKNQNIIWYSDYVIPENTIYGNGFIYSIEDINRDGKVEIMTQWESEGTARYNYLTLFVHSWDGVQGELVVDVSNEGSPIQCPNYKGFMTIDIEGDGVFEIISLWEDDAPEVFEWNGINYVPSSTVLNSIEKFFPRNNFEPVVNAIVKKENGSFVYEYTVKNSENSSQSINEFDVYGFDEYIKKYGSITVKDTSVLTFAPRWYGNLLNTEVTWYGYPIKPGNSLNGFLYIAKALPVIGYAYLRGYNYQWSGDYENNTSVDDYLRNSVIVKTLAAKLPPEPFIPNDFIDTLKSYTDSSYSLGWIKDEQTRDKYYNYFNTAKTYLEQGDSSTARAELQKVLTDCNTDSSTVLTSEAYALLYFNTEYLFNKLPDKSKK